jgi:hypothetical protein
MDIDLSSIVLSGIIDAATTEAAIRAGVPDRALKVRCANYSRVIGGGARPLGSPRWLPAELRFLKNNIGKMTDKEIGAEIGRTETAVKIKRQRSGYPAHSKRPGWMTGRAAGEILGLDIHGIMTLTERGLLPHVVIPGQRGILALKRVTLFRWAVNPLNWIYFKPEKVRDARLRRMIELKRARWGDEWWTSQQVARLHGVHHTDVQRYIEHGKIKAVKYGNWHVLRSEAERPGLTIPKAGKGSGHELDWSEECDLFWLIGMAVGLSSHRLDAMSKLPRKRSSYRVLNLMETGTIRELMEKYDLNILYNPERRLVWADWRDFPGRFPPLDKAMGRFLAGEKISLQEMYLVRGVLASWAAWFGAEVPLMVSARWSNEKRIEKLWDIVEALKSVGADLTTVKKQGANNENEDRQMLEYLRVHCGFQA